ILLCQIRKISWSPTRQCPVHLRMGQTLVHQESIDHLLCQRTPYAYIMAAYQVPLSPDYIPGLEIPPSPDYILGPEEPQSPPPLDFISKPMYPEYIPQEDEILSAEEQTLPAAVLPTTNSPGYVSKSDLEEELEEDNKDLEEDPADYLNDRDDDDDDDDDEDKDEEEVEEHPAPADFVPSVHRMTARISIRDEPSISLPPREEVERLLALTTPPPSPLTPLSSPLPHIPSPPLPASPPASPIRLLGYRAAMIWLRAETPSTSHPLPLPTTSPLLQLLFSDHRTDRPEITLPPQKRLGIDLGPRADYGFVGTMDIEIRRQRAKEVGYGIRYVWVDPREAVGEVAPMTLRGVNTRVTELNAVQEQDTQDIYYHYETARQLDQEALVSREAWGCSIEVSYMTHSKILALRSVVLGQQAVISQLQAADRKSQVVTLEMLQADYQRQKMAPKRRTTRLNLDATPTPTPVTDTHTTTSVTNAQIQAMINKGVTAVLAAHDATRNGDDSHTSGTGVRRPVQLSDSLSGSKRWSMFTA
ncbi:hypothetical protein Tco_1414829, partial [Tanacetum coccineum]